MPIKENKKVNISKSGDWNITYKINNEFLKQSRENDKKSQSFFTILNSIYFKTIQKTVYHQKNTCTKYLGLIFHACRP